MSFLFRSLTATFCFSWYAHIVAILHRKTYLIQPVIQLSKFNRAPQGVVSGVRGEYPKEKNIFRFLLLLTNWRIILEFGKKLFDNLTLNCLLLSKNGVLSGFSPFTSSEWGRGMYTPLFRKEFFNSKQKQPKTLYLRGFSAEKIF